MVVILMASDNTNVGTDASRSLVRHAGIWKVGNASQRPDLAGCAGEIFAEMLAHWDLGRPSVIAHDFGGVNALRAHLLHGRDYERLVLMNVVAVRPWAPEYFKHIGRHASVFQGLPPRIHRAVVEAYIQGALVNPLRDDDVDKLVQPWLTPEGTVSFYQQFAQSDEKYTEEIEAAFGLVRCPVNIIWGERDPWIPLEQGEQLHGLIPHSKFETIPKAGHMPQLEMSDAVVERLSAILPTL